MIVLFYALLILPFYFLHSGPKVPVFSLVVSGNVKALLLICRSTKFQNKLFYILGFPK